MNYTDKLIKEYLKEDVVEFPKEILNDVTDLRGTPSYGKTDYRCPKCGSRDVEILGQDTGADPAKAPDGTGIGYSYGKATYCHCNSCDTYFEHDVRTTTTITTEVIPVARFFLSYDVIVDPTKQTIYSGDRDDVYKALYNDCEMLSEEYGTYGDIPGFDRNGNISIDGLTNPEDDGTGRELINCITSFAKKPPINGLEKIIKDALNKDDTLDKVITFLKDKDKLKEVDEGSQFANTFLFDSVSVDNDACFVSLAIGSSNNSDEDGIIL